MFQLLDHDGSRSVPPSRTGRRRQDRTARPDVHTLQSQRKLGATIGQAASDHSGLESVHINRRADDPLTMPDCGRQEAGLGEPDSCVGSHAELNPTAVVRPRSHFEGETWHGVGSGGHSEQACRAQRRGQDGQQRGCPRPSHGWAPTVQPLNASPSNRSIVVKPSTGPRLSLVSCLTGLPIGRKAAMA